MFTGHFGPFMDIRLLAMLCQRGTAQPGWAVSLSPNEEQYVAGHMAGVMVVAQSLSASWDMLDSNCVCVWTGTCVCPHLCLHYLHACSGNCAAVFMHMSAVFVYGLNVVTSVLFVGCSGLQHMPTSLARESQQTDGFFFSSVWVSGWK